MAFRFKQFSIEDDKSSIKVGTDAVLLGAWAGQGNPGLILDIGTGCGLVALMMAQRFQGANVHGIDIHKPSTDQAGENFSKAPWSDRLEAKNISYQLHAEHSKIKYDLIVTNPPFFSGSLLPPDDSKKISKHTSTLTYLEIINGVSNLLTEEGTLSLILPYEKQDEAGCL